MKNVFFLITFLISSLLFSQKEDIMYAKYSYSQFFEMIENETDSVFNLKNAIIFFDAKTDSKYSFSENRNSIKERRNDTIYIKKELNLERVNFNSKSGNQGEKIAIHHVSFEKKVILKNSYKFHFRNCTFKKEFELEFTDYDENQYKNFKKQDGFISNYTVISDSNFEDNVTVFAKSAIDGENKTYNTQLQFYNNNFISKRDLNLRLHSFYITKLTTFNFSGNSFLDESKILIDFYAPDNNSIVNNNFNNSMLFLTLSDIAENSNLDIENNFFNTYTFLNVEMPKQKHSLDWSQFNEKVIEQITYDFDFTDYLVEKYPNHDFTSEGFYKKEYLLEYVNLFRVENNRAFRQESKMRFGLYNFYKTQGNLEFANEIYVSAKELQTQRNQYLYSQNPSFNSYFTFKIGQFLKIFSNYGTNPAKSVVVSMYVIFLFALIYLFFPNTWDAHGKNRIIDRYLFFLKYMNKNAGIHEVYLEDQQQEITSYDNYKSLIIASKETAPKFFFITGFPLYKWAISGTKLSAFLLKRVDIMKGIWSELPPKKQFWKSILLVSVFLVAIIYDIFIKMLNALMLSINTFTTLGFGEIPIKGLPRYLAIIQGFIGWFMLTIFSVSLISQLLN